MFKESIKNEKHEAFIQRYTYSSCISVAMLLTQSNCKLEEECKS